MRASLKQLPILKKLDSFIIQLLPQNFDKSLR